MDESEPPGAAVRRRRLRTEKNNNIPRHSNGPWALTAPVFVLSSPGLRQQDRRQWNPPFPPGVHVVASVRLLWPSRIDSAGRPSAALENDFPLFRNKLKGSACGATSRALIRIQSGKETESCRKTKRATCPLQWGRRSCCPHQAVWVLPNAMACPSTRKRQASLLIVWTPSCQAELCARRRTAREREKKKEVSQSCSTTPSSTRKKNEKEPKCKNPSKAIFLFLLAFAFLISTLAMRKHRSE